ASALQHRASAWIARLQAAGAGGLHPGIRAGGPATPTSDAARAGATTIIALTIKLDPSVGADHPFQRLHALHHRRCALSTGGELFGQNPRLWAHHCQRLREHGLWTDFS